MNEIRKIKKILKKYEKLSSFYGKDLHFTFEALSIYSESESIILQKWYDTFEEIHESNRFWLIKVISLWICSNFISYHIKKLEQVGKKQQELEKLRDEFYHIAQQSKFLKIK